MVIIFFLVVTPISIILKIFGKDVLNLKFNNNKIENVPTVFEKPYRVIGFSKNTNQDFDQEEDRNGIVKVIQNNGVLIRNVVRTGTSVNGRRHNHRNHQARKELAVPNTQKEIDKLSHNFSRLLYILSLKKLNPAKAGLRERNPLNGLTKLSPKYQKDNGKRYLKY